MTWLVSAGGRSESSVLLLCFAPGLSVALHVGWESEQRCGRRAAAAARRRHVGISACGGATAADGLRVCTLSSGCCLLGMPAVE